jgi:beta-1,4-mannosyl-glycoprotein beta-1,4-N-acetylglucosaminyltransferase
MILDTFMFFNEYDILEGRLEYLYDKVDKFIIVEADHTFTGKPKELNFAKNMDRYSKYLSKVFYYPIKISKATLKKHDPWKVETEQRNAISKALDFFSDFDIVIVGDLDEIPSHHSLRNALSMLNQYPAVTLVYDAYIYNFGFKHQLIEGKFKNVLDGFAHNVITTNRFVKSKSPQVVRDKRHCYANMNSNFAQGWHLTYWGTDQNIKNKIEAYSHTERSTPEFTSLENIADKKSKGMMFTDSFHSTLESVDIRKIDPTIFSIFRKYSKPLPHYHDMVEGWFSKDDIEFYKCVVDQFDSPSHFVEVGSYKGKSTVCLAVEILNQNKDIKIDCVDIWEPNLMYKDLTLQEFMYNIAPVKDIITPIKMTSEDAAKCYADQSIDFVFIDADHSYEAVKKDIMLWWPKVKKGGVIAGHDEYFPEVKEAVTKIFDNYVVVGSCWFVIKK